MKTQTGRKKKERRIRKKGENKTHERRKKDT